MSTCEIGGIHVKFPFVPYQIQKDYMEQVILCLKTKSNGVLESPTGTGKTLSLLCSSLAWLETVKAQIQLEKQTIFKSGDDEFTEKLQAQLSAGLGQAGSSRAFLGVPTIIYTSRTHSQLAQAMQELKRTAYSYMKASVLGSREQLCIHPEISKLETNSLKTMMCGQKVKTRSCHFYNRLETIKEDSNLCEQNIVDIEDLVRIGQKQKFCPYYMAKKLKNRCDIVFMPYTYVLDPVIRRSLDILLANNVVIFDEAHNIEKQCEESASIQIKSTDITLCIDEITAVMKAMTDAPIGFDDGDSPKDFTAEELCSLKQIFLDFERELDSILLSSNTEGTTFGGLYVYDFLDKAGINQQTNGSISKLLKGLVEFLTVQGSENPFQRGGSGLQLFSDFLQLVFSIFSGFSHKIDKCYKVHIVEEETNKKRGVNTWLSKSSKSSCRVLSFWCFSPGFGMSMLQDQNVRNIILTSGTLAPLAPLITELEITIPVSLENPHVIKGNQICVKVITKGPDNEPLICNYQNRDNENYKRSLGYSILNLTRMIPDGLLIFFPSYPMMLNCQKNWQEKGIWSNICEQKAIYVEPRDKTSFNNAMTEYYAKIQDSNFKGAIFMGVCRGKLAEGLDFADRNGRAVIVIGLPFPPLRDPKIVLKKRYLDTCHGSDKQYITGDKWYSLEACRAVNQAIGRVIRHKDDYGAIILLDSKFANYNVQSNLSLWLRGRIQTIKEFGEITRDLRLFFKNAEKILPIPVSKLTEQEQAPTIITNPLFIVPQRQKRSNFDFSESSLSGEVAWNKRRKNECHPREQPHVRKKISVIPNNAMDNDKPRDLSNGDIKEYILMVQKALDDVSFKTFVTALKVYKETLCLEKLLLELDVIFLPRHNLRYIMQGIQGYIIKEHKESFNEYWVKMR